MTTVQRNIPIFGNLNSSVKENQNSINSNGDYKKEKEKVASNIALNAIPPLNAGFYNSEYYIPNIREI